MEGVRESVGARESVEHVRSGGESVMKMYMKVCEGRV